MFKNIGCEVVYHLNDDTSLVAYCSIWGYHAPRNKDFREVSIVHFSSYLRRVKQTWASTYLINESITQSPYLYEIGLFFTETAIPAWFLIVV